MRDWINIAREQFKFQGKKISNLHAYLHKPLQVLKQAPLATAAVLGASSTGAPLVIAAGLGVSAYAAQNVMARGIVSYPKTDEELLDELKTMSKTDFLRSPTRSTLTDVPAYINFARKQLRSFNNCLDLRYIPLENFNNVADTLRTTSLPSCLKKIIFKPNSSEQMTELICTLKTKNLPEDFSLEIIGDPSTYTSDESFVQVKPETPDSSLFDKVKTSIKGDPVYYAFQETGKEAKRQYGEHLAEHVERLKAVKKGEYIKTKVTNVADEAKKLIYKNFFEVLVKVIVLSGDLLSHIDEKEDQNSSKTRETNNE